MRTHHNQSIRKRIWIGRSYCRIHTCLGASHSVADTAPANHTGNIQPSNSQIERFDFAKDLSLDVTLDKPEAAFVSYKRGLEISDCVMKSEDVDLTTMVDGEFAKSGDFKQLMKGMRKGNSFCVKSDKPAIPFFVNAAMGERYVQSLDRTDQTILPRPANMAAARHFFMGGKEDVSLFTIGRCVSVLSPQLAMAVLDTTVGSKYETAALDRLYSTTPMWCVKATPAKIPAAFQRATISTALCEWHRVSHLQS